MACRNTACAMQRLQFHPMGRMAKRGRGKASAGTGRPPNTPTPANWARTHGGEKWRQSSGDTAIA
eukprot:7322138-Lingulodinium_polyedra.AAC.1